MRNRLCHIALLVGTLASVTATASADEMNRLQGAWGSEGFACNKIFAIKKGHATFVRYHGEALAGFIVNGTRIEAGRAACNVISHKSNGDVTALLLGCREEIILDRVTISLRLIDDNNVTRLHPEFPGIETKFHRCGNPQAR
jgi:hypothetical protein